MVPCDDDRINSQHSFEKGATINHRVNSRLSFEKVVSQVQLLTHSFSTDKTYTGASFRVSLQNLNENERLRLRTDETRKNGV